jgi:hypothetical protein
MKNKNLSGNLFTKQALTIKETALSASIAEWLDLKRVYNDRLNSGKIKFGTRMIHLCKTGTPDRFAILEGQIIFIEVKQKGKKATTEQLMRHNELRNSGAIVIVADSFDDFERKFNDVKDEVRGKTDLSDTYKKMKCDKVLHIKKENK